MAEQLNSNDPMYYMGSFQQQQEATRESESMTLASWLEKNEAIVSPYKGSGRKKRGANIQIEIDLSSIPEEARRDLMFRIKDFKVSKVLPEGPKVVLEPKSDDIDTYSGMKKLGIDVQEVAKIAGGLENILEADLIGPNQWMLEVRRITPSGNYRETILIEAACGGKSVSKKNKEKVSTPVVRKDIREVVAAIDSDMNEALTAVRPKRKNSDEYVISLKHTVESRKIHNQLFSINERIHPMGWHVSIVGESVWTLKPLSGTLNESESKQKQFDKWFKEADKAMQKKIGMSVNDMEDWRWWDEFDSGTTPEDAVEEFIAQSDDPFLRGMMDMWEESDARKRAYKNGVPVTPQHVLAQSTDGLQQVKIGEEDKEMKNETTLQHLRESDARKRAARFYRHMYPDAHFLAQSTDALLQPSIETSKKEKEKE